MYHARAGSMSRERAFARLDPRASANQFPICFSSFSRGPPIGFLKYSFCTTLAHNREAGASPTFSDSRLSVSGSEHGLFKTPEYVHSNLTGHLASNGVFNNHSTIRRAISYKRQVNTCEQKGGVSFVSSLQINYLVGFGNQGVNHFNCN